MLHARDHLLADEAALGEVDSVQLIEQGLVGKGLAEAVVQPTFRDAEPDAHGVVVLLRPGRAAKVAHVRASSKQNANPEFGEPRVGVRDGAFRDARNTAPSRRDRESRLLADLDLRPETVEGEPLCQLASLVFGDIEQESVAGGHDKKIEKDFPLRAEQAGMDRLAILRLADIAGNQPLQIFACVGTRDAKNAAAGKKRRMAMAHIPPFCYLSV